MLSELKDLDLEGAYTKKECLSKIIRDNFLGLGMLALIHTRGTVKYAPHSWCNAPYTSNSSVTENLDAIFRHFGSYTMGKTVDPEGFPHLFHMCCRAGMFISMAYRLAYHIPHTNLQDVDAELADILPDFNLLNGRLITSEEILALSKRHLYKIPQGHLKLIPYIQGLLTCLAYGTRDYDLKDEKSKQAADEYFINESFIAPVNMYYDRCICDALFISILDLAADRLAHDTIYINGKLLNDKERGMIAQYLEGINS